MRGLGFLLVLFLNQGAPAQTPAAKAVGTVKSNTANVVVITSDSGADTTITFADSARIVRAAPGQTDLKSANPIQTSDIQVGDRLFARGQPGENGALVASSVIVMKKTDIAQRQQTERDEWRRGLGGIVKELNAAAGTITVANSLAASGKPILVHVSTQTVVRRYSPGSVRFDDAKPGTLDEIKPGDQLRARGTKNADGTEFTAQAIVSGTFRNISGTVVSTDAANKSLTVMDLVAKKTVVVKVTGDSELRKLPPMAAARIAMRLKGGSPDASADSGAPAQGKSESGNAGQSHAGDNRGSLHGQGSGVDGNSPAARGTGGPPDFQQILSRMPAIAISDLNKGDAIMLVATEGTSTSDPTAIKLIAGVEPILSAAPAGTGAAMILSPWNLSAGESAGGDSASQ